VTTNDPELADRVRVLRDHGQARKYYHDVEGYNGRLDAMQAGFLDVKLRHLPKWNEQRRFRASEYNRILADHPGVVTPYEPSWSKAVYHLYVVRVDDRDGLMAHLKDAGIGSGIHYPVPLHLQRAYRTLNYREGDFPVCERIAREILSLPMYPQLTNQQQMRVAEEVIRFTTARAKQTKRNNPLAVAEVSR
jgi:dTDP-4-amino-4,6-dideoxygalactose transaminase